MPDQKNSPFAAAALNSAEVAAVSGAAWYTVSRIEMVNASSDMDGGPSRLVERTVTERYWIN